MDQQNLGLDGSDKGTPPEKPAWMAQLPDDLKGNETFTAYKTIGDLAKSHLDVSGKVKELDGKSAKITELEGKLTNSIPKLSDKATDQEKVAYYKSLGVPDKPEEYEFPKAEGVEHSEEMVNWFRGVAHQAKLTKESAAIIGTAWDGLMSAMIDEEIKQADIAKKEARDNFRKEFKSDEEFNAAETLVGRYWEKVTGDKIEKFLEDTGIGNDIRLIKFIYENAKKTGEDLSPQGSQKRGEEVKTEIVYDKSPPPPSQEVR